MEGLNSGGQGIRDLSFQWRTVRWFLIVFSFNILIPLLIIADRLIAKHNDLHNALIVPQAIVFPTLLVCAFGAYVYMSRSFFREHSEAIKASRFRYFSWGMVLSFVSFCAYAVSLAASCASDAGESWTKILIYCALGFCCVLGTASTALITVYEFCISFDVFYSKNKIDIVREYLSRTANALKIEEQEKIDED